MGECLSICTTKYLGDENINKINKSQFQLPVDDISKLINSNIPHKRKAKRRNTAPIKPVKFKLEIGLVSRSSKSKKEIFNFEEIIDGNGNKKIGKSRKSLDSLYMSDLDDEEKQKKRIEEIWNSLSTKLVTNNENESQTQSDDSSDEEEDDEISDIKVSLEEEKEEKNANINNKEINKEKIEKENIQKKGNENINKKEGINNDSNKEIVPKATGDEEDEEEEEEDEE